MDELKPYLWAIGVVLLWAATTLAYEWGQESKEIVSLVKECIKSNRDFTYDNYISPSQGKKLTCKVHKDVPLK